MYALNLVGASHDPADAAVRYLGVHPSWWHDDVIGPAVVGRDGTVTDVVIRVFRIGTAPDPATEVATLALMVNGVPTAIGTLAINAGIEYTLITNALAVAVVEGDELMVRFTFPTWATTNPTQLHPTGHILIRDTAEQAALDDHSARHENGGADEISIASLDGTSVDLAAHLADAADAHDASAISFVAAGDIAATTVQAAIEEVNTEGDTATALVQTNLDAHTADAVAAHAASAIAVTPAGTLAAIEVQAALVEVLGDVETHVADAVGAHAASAISNTPAGNIVATELQAAVNELDGQDTALQVLIDAIEVEIGEPFPTSRIDALEVLMGAGVFDPPITIAEVVVRLREQNLLKPISGAGMG